jgi:hypothetical protein
VRKLAFGPQSGFEKRLGYAVAAFEALGYRPRDEDVYLMYGEPGRMHGRFTLHDNPHALHGPRAPLGELDATDELYFDNVSQIKMQNWSRGRVALAEDAAFRVSLLAGQGSALAMIAAIYWPANSARRRADISRHLRATRLGCAAISMPNSAAPSALLALLRPGRGQA